VRSEKCATTIVLVDVEMVAIAGVGFVEDVVAIWAADNTIAVVLVWILRIFVAPTWLLFDAMDMPILVLFLEKHQPQLKLSRF